MESGFGMNPVLDLDGIKYYLNNTVYNPTAKLKLYNPGGEQWNF